MPVCKTFVEMELYSGTSHPFCFKTLLNRKHKKEFIFYSNLHSFILQMKVYVVDSLKNCGFVVLEVGCDDDSTNLNYV